MPHKVCAGEAITTITIGTAVPAWNVLRGIGHFWLCPSPILVSMRKASWGMLRGIFFPGVTA